MGYSPWGRKSRTQFSDYTTTMVKTQCRVGNLGLECLDLIPVLSFRNGVTICFSFIFCKKYRLIVSYVVIDKSK